MLFAWGRATQTPPHQSSPGHAPSGLQGASQRSLLLGSSALSLTRRTPAPQAPRFCWPDSPADALRLSPAQKRPPPHTHHIRVCCSLLPHFYPHPRSDPKFWEGPVSTCPSVCSLVCVQPWVGAPCSSHGRCRVKVGGSGGKIFPRWEGGRGADPVQPRPAPEPSRSPAGALPEPRRSPASAPARAGTSGAGTADPAPRRRRSPGR